MTEPHKLTEPNRPAPPKSKKGGGVFIVLALVVGVIAGIVLGQPSVGMAAGLGFGVAIALFVWLWDRRA